MLEEKVLTWLMGLVDQKVTVTLAVEGYNLIKYHQEPMHDDGQYCAGLAVSTGSANDWPAFIGQYSSEEEYQKALAIEGL